MASKGDSKDKGGGGLMPLIIAAVISIVAGLGAGYGVVTAFVPPPGSENKPASPDKPAKDAHAPADDHGASKEEKPAHGNEGEAAAEEEEAVEPVDPADVAFVPFPPVITNVAEPKTVWLRLEGGITYLKSGEKKAEILASETAQQITQYLRTVDLADIEGQDGLQFLQDDLNDISRNLSGGQVQNVLISGLIVE